KASNYNIENNRNRLFEINGKYYNKVISLYGANASGKTTFLKSIVVLSAVINNESTEKFPTSFKNKFAHLSTKSEIEIGFILDLIFNKKCKFQGGSLKNHNTPKPAIQAFELFKESLTFLSSLTLVIKIVRIIHGNNLPLWHFLLW
ncbi:MAG: AAA family ATPase, partial [Candidatus Parabeggiatoa sp.]|nr:AAA family ATPase [Candidatus Parabeggiatoa sp.]